MTIDVGTMMRDTGRPGILHCIPGQRWVHAGHAEAGLDRTARCGL
jgi:hypothetical protein